MSHLTRGARLGVDVGEVRVGVAVSDPDGILATPVVTLTRDLGPRDGRSPRRAPEPTRPAVGPTGPAEDAANAAVPADISELARLVELHSVVEVVVGLPVTLAGGHGPAAIKAKAYAAQLAEAIAPVPVILVDERMSTVVASRRLSERGVRGKRKRGVVDQAAAVEILQSWLEAQRRRT